MTIKEQLTIVEGKLSAIEEKLIVDGEMRNFGHRIDYDLKTGWSQNVAGVYCPPELIDQKTGYQVRLK